MARSENPFRYFNSSPEVIRPGGDDVREIPLSLRAEFFGAPVGIFFLIDRKMGPPQWSDLGMYIPSTGSPTTSI
jgi:hypothetical protein